MLIKDLLNDLGPSNYAIPIPNVSGIGFVHQTSVTKDLLENATEWCCYQRNNDLGLYNDDLRYKSTKVGERDQHFMKPDRETLFDIIVVGGCSPIPKQLRSVDGKAANFLYVKELLDIGCAPISNMTKE
ncbi:hypothetical protein PENANT_c105G03091 [Penicillium antarcticum]|uniref:Uncharacterized protein n=1 Tax=Penicillium antarcticum TaxID=416450 RepID=A0A1V6PK48_9EURO|nr:hypothetical protein PENANT_c213G01671 [Penicillium antarcticum]OQD77408.1 hypothetical protein PENANT_c105G03091 [Penicillium antarcticum]